MQQRFQDGGDSAAIESPGLWFDLLNSPYTVAWIANWRHGIAIVSAPRMKPIRIPAKSLPE
jgi:hypothetical protein